LFDASAAKVMIMSCKSIDGVQNWTELVVKR
jgi:hypothetical protein